MTSLFTLSGQTALVTGASRGLGLAICNHMVEAHGQTMLVRIKVDVGTTIGFTLDTRKE